MHECVEVQVVEVQVVEVQVVEVQVVEVQVVEVQVVEVQVVERRSFYLAYGCYELMGAWGETWWRWCAYIRPTNETKIST